MAVNTKILTTFVLFLHVVNTELGSVTSILISPDMIKFNVHCNYNAIATLKAILCGCTGKRIFIGFIQTMHFVEKQHNLTLKALIIFSHLKI